MDRIVKKFALVGTATALAVAGNMASVAPAHADGSGCSVFSSVPAKGWPAGWLCITVTGSGTKINSQRATWRATQLCNWRIDWVTYYNGKVWYQEKGPVHGCNNLTGERYRGSGYAPAGSTLCAKLVKTSTGAKIDEACVDIN